MAISLIVARVRRFNYRTNFSQMYFIHIGRKKPMSDHIDCMIPSKLFKSHFLAWAVARRR